MNSFLIVTIFGLLVAGLEVKSYPASPENDLKVPKISRAPIYGGRPAEQDEAPYMLSISYLLGHFCGAALVEVNGIQVAITSANCVNEFGTAVYQILGGELDLINRSGYEQKRQATSAVRHQNYSAATRENNIAVLFIQQFDLNEHVKPVRLPSQGQELSGGNLTISAWANNIGEVFRNFHLKILEFPVIDETVCAEAYPDFYGNRSDSLMCAFAEPLPANITYCKGAGGGPAVSEEGILTGIVSECVYYGGAWAQLRETPLVYTKVTQYVDWIYSTVENHLKHTN